MTISASKELFLAILAMDSYNRGYGAGIDLAGSSVGPATIATDSIQEIGLTTTTNAGFYAAAYTLTGTVGTGDNQIAPGPTIIS